MGFFAGGTLLALFDFRTTFLCGAALVVGALLTLPRPQKAARAPADGARTDARDEESGSAEPAATERHADPPEDVRRTFRAMGWLANFAAVGALRLDTIDRTVFSRKGVFTHFTVEAASAE